MKLFLISNGKQKFLSEKLNDFKDISFARIFTNYSMAKVVYEYCEDMGKYNQKFKNCKLLQLDCSIKEIGINKDDSTQ